MSYKIVDELLADGLLEPQLKLVLLSLARHANDSDRIDAQSRESWPGKETIAYESGYDERTVGRHLKTLEKMGLIIDVTEYAPDPDGQRKRTTKYGGPRATTHYLIATAEERTRIFSAEQPKRSEKTARKRAAYRNRKPRQSDTVNHVNLTRLDVEETTSGCPPNHVNVTPNHVNNDKIPCQGDVGICNESVK